MNQRPTAIESVGESSKPLDSTSGDIDIQDGIRPVPDRLDIDPNLDSASTQAQPRVETPEKQKRLLLQKIVTPSMSLISFILIAILIIYFSTNSF